MQLTPSWLEQILVDEPQVWQQQAVDAALADTLCAKAFGITPENVEAVVLARSHLLRSIYFSTAFSEFCQSIKLPPSLVLDTLWHLWLPLAIHIASYRQAQPSTLILGILAGQGTGKTTLAKILILILAHLKYHAISLSLDDLYKTYSDRLALQKQDPRLIWRGPPGTHDLKLGLTVLDQLRQPDFKQIEIPRFDKSAYDGEGDRTAPEIVEKADIVLFEGWFVGVPPIDPVCFDTAPPPIVTPDDRDFAHDMNTRLQDYLPLWKRLDRLILLYPVDYRLSLEWRKQAEHQMIATGKSGMSDAQIEQFVNYFWRSLHPDLFIKPLTRDPSRVDLVIEINAARSIGAIYHPGDAQG